VATGRLAEHRREWVFPLALLTLAALITLHLTTAPVNGVFALAPIIASTTLGVRRTALVAGLAVAASVLVGLAEQPVDLTAWLLRAALCAVISAIAVLSAARRIRRERELTQMTAIAAAAQQAVLGTLPTSLGPTRLAARHVSATANALIGGDLYEAVSSPFGVRMIVGDVKGKGLGAVQLAATVLGAFRQGAATQPDLTRLVLAIDAVVSAVSSDEDFVTAVLVQVGHDEHVDLVCCGHHPPLMVRPDGAAEIVDTEDENTPFGLGPQPLVVRVRWPAGTRMLVYTDGLVEARDAAGRFFPLAEHAADLSKGSLDQALDRLVAELLRHSGRRLHDDMAVLLVERVYCGTCTTS
jgi:serine phosphatase RsbU (regulator of sigma subunit)